MLMMMPVKISNMMRMTMMMVMMMRMKSLVIRNGGSPVVVIRSHMPSALGKVIQRAIDYMAYFPHPSIYSLTIS